MLTGYQTEVVAFITDGGVVCADCARRLYGEIATAGSERGLTSGYDLSPLIRYSLDEWNGEAVYDRAREIADEREIDPSDWQAIDAIVEELGDSYDQVCDECSEVIS